MNKPQTPFDYSLPEIIIAAVPAAGTDFTEPVPANTIWLVHSINLRLTTAVAAATRTVTIQINNGALVNTIGLAGVTQLASLTRDYVFIPGNHSNLTDTFIAGCLPPRLFLQPGWGLNSVVQNIQAADAITAIRFVVQRWLTTVT